MFAAASREDFDRVLPLLQACSREVRYVGPEPGSGQTVKLVNQILSAVHMMAAAEALAFTRTLGLDQHAVFNMVRSGAGASFIFENYGKRMIDGPYDPPTAR